MSLKNPVTPPGIDPGTVRLVEQRLNHYATTLLGMPVSSLLTGIPSSHLHKLIIPDDVLIQFDLLMMSTVTLETCREMK